MAAGRPALAALLLAALWIAAASGGFSAFTILGDERLRKMKVPELKSLLRDMGCKADGSKADLVQRCYNELLFGEASFSPDPAPWSKRVGSTADGGAAAKAASAALLAVAAAPAEVEDPDAPRRMQVRDLEVGTELAGNIVRIVESGCFVDVGAVRDGFVPIARIAETYVHEVSLFVHVGQAVRVWVTYVTEDGKLGLTMVRHKTSFLPGEDRSSVDIRARWAKVREQQRREEADTFAAFKGVKPDEWLEARVTSLTGWALYVSLEPPGGGRPVEGMVHVSQIHDGYAEDPALEAEVGQTVRVRVLDVKPALGKMTLTMREGEVKVGKPYPEHQSVSKFVGIPPTEWLPARVHHFTYFGIFVEMAPPGGGEVVQGCVHVKEIREGWVDDLAEEVEIGQDIMVRILRLDAPAGKLYLSMKEP